MTMPYILGNNFVKKMKSNLIAEQAWEITCESTFEILLIYMLTMFNSGSNVWMEIIQLIKLCSKFSYLGNGFAILSSEK